MSHVTPDKINTQEKNRLVSRGLGKLMEREIFIHIYLGLNLIAPTSVMKSANMYQLFTQIKIESNPILIFFNEYTNFNTFGGVGKVAKPSRDF